MTSTMLNKLIKAFTPVDIPEFAKENFDRYFVQSDKIMLFLIVFQWIISTFITSITYKTYLYGFIGGGVIVLLIFVAHRYISGTRLMRVLIAIGMMLFSLIYIQQHLGRIEMHFYIFIAMAILAFYKDTMPIFIAAGTTILHHLIFNYLQYYEVSLFGMPIMVFNYGCGLDIVLLHGLFVCIEALVLIYLINLQIEHTIDLTKAKNEVLELNGELSKNEAQLIELLEASPIAVRIAEAKRQSVVFANKAYLILINTSSQEVIGKNPQNYYAREEEYQKIVETLLRGEVVCNKLIELRVGECEKWALASYIPFEFDGEQSVLEWLYDVTDEIRTQQMLTLQKEEFETIFKGSKDGIAIVDLQSFFFDFNDAYLEMTGFSREELLRRSCIELSAPEDTERAKLAIKEAIKTGFVKNFEKNCILQGRIVTVNMSITLLPDKKRLLIVSKDITEKRILENTLKKTNERLQELVQEELAKNRDKDLMLQRQSRMAAMGEMIGNISHQWRQPLNALALSIQDVQMAQAYGELDEKYIDDFKTTSMNLVNYMSQTIDDFRNFFKLDKKKTEFEVKEAINKSLSIVKDSLRSLFVEVDIAIPNEKLMTLGYPNEFSQVLLNILNNAREALKDRKDSTNRNIKISAHKDNNTIKVTICDNALGIQPGIIDKIFDPYFTTKHQSQGTGLGLYMSKMIIEQNMGGKLYVYNTQDGACFVVEIPLATINQNVEDKEDGLLENHNLY